MKVIITILIVSCTTFAYHLTAQNLEVEGKVKITMMDTLTSATTTVVRKVDGTLGIRQYKIGDFAQGGIVFWIDETGEHGLVCAKEDQSTGVRWYAGSEGNTQAKGDGPYAGEMNTAIIIASLVAIGDDGSTYAARICSELQITEGGFTYADWYLPSEHELTLLYQNRVTIDVTAGANGGSSFAAASYSSSTESSSGGARSRNFENGNPFNGGKNLSLHVRAVRAF
jgi:hypothetical protein